jgi:cytochrome c553
MAAHQFQRWPTIVLPLALCFAVLLTTPAVAAGTGATGREIYKTQCAQCHGANGEGVEDHCPDPLHGDRSLEELTKVITETMPEDEPEKCAGDRAKRVAEYLYETFYTEAARAKHKPPRIELSRLTVRQYDHAVADLIGGFVGEGRLGDQRGLKARYFNARNFRGDKKVFERIDPKITFDFKEGSPEPGKIGAAEFAIQWQGGLIAEETGDYEIILHTENGARLWVNDSKKALIDAWVKSGDNTEHTATIRLLGGRVYPIRLDYFKFKDKTASVELGWQPPHRAREVIPKRNLSPDWFPQTFVITTEFPADDSSVGYERGTSVSKAWDHATTRAAVEVANAVVDNLEFLAKCRDDAPDREQRLKQFCYRFAERAFRRPLTDEQKQFFVGARFEEERDPERAVKKVVLLALKSPRFLYVGIGGGELDDYGVAERLSFGLWDSVPDEPLWQAASQGKLHTRAEVENQARRMLANPRTKAKLRYFLHKWLDVERGFDVLKDEELYPEFNDLVKSDLLTSLDLFLDDVVWSEPSDFRQLLLADHLFLNDRLAKFYDVEVPSGDGFHRVSVNPAQRAGVLTHPYVMTGLAYHKTSSPIHRGVFLVRGVLGRALKPPPMAVTPLDEGFDPAMTTRQRVAVQTKPANCQICHGMINPLGFSLEHYDAVGRYRAKEKDKPIDASGSYRTVSGDLAQFNGGRKLAEFLAASDEAHRCFVEQLFHHMIKQPVSAFGPREQQGLHDAFAKADFSIRELLVEIMKASALKEVP